MVEGASERRKRRRSTSKPRCAAASAGGEGAKEIAAALALATGKPRRQIYQLALALKRD